MIWSLALIAVVVVCKVHANDCPGNLPILVKLQFKTRYKAMHMTAVPDSENPFKALAGSTTKFSLDRQFKFRLKVKEEWEDRVSTFFKLDEVCFYVRGAQKVIASFTLYPSGNKQKTVKPDHAEWEQVCFSRKGTIKGMNFKFQPYKGNVIEVKHFKSNTCHAPVPEPF